MRGLVVFAVFRGLNGYGNMFLYRDGDSWQQWLHVSKYPPSLSFTSLELGLLYPACRWFRTLKAAHPDSVLKYFRTRPPLRRRMPLAGGDGGFDGSRPDQLDQGPIGRSSVVG